MKKICLLIALCIVAASSYATTYCTPTFGSPCSSYPMKASIGNLTGSSGAISDTTPCVTSSYENMTSLSVTLTAGASYTTTLALSALYYSSFSVQIWIDFNNDGTFSSSESVGGGSYFSSASPTITIVMPGSAPTGTWRMRMVNNYQCCGASAYPSMNPCPTTAISYGDARDYTVNIVPAGPVITATPASLSFGTIAAGTTSSPQNGVIAGAYLSPAAGNLTVTAPTDFEVCSTSGGTYANSYTIAYTGATVSATSVFVRYVAPSTPGSSGGNVVISGGSATANIAVAGSAGCSGTPASGGTSGLFYSGGACATAPSITLNNTGYTADPGIVFQWQSSPTGSSSWANISGATNAFSVVTGAGTTTYYRCVVTCSLSGLSTNSTTSGDTIDRVKGRIAYAATAPDTLDTKVWLIYHNVSAGTLTAIDSVTTCLDGGVAYYEFNGMGTGSYIVKGKVLDASSTVVGASGFVPTYGASNPHWDTAVTVTHTVATTDSMDINMVYGTVPAGPGFIGGLITSGAGKNTASDIPAANMIVFLMDAAHHVLTHTYTNATGNYSFGSIAYGNYYIYPEDLNYTTTPSAMLPLSSGTASLPAINFKQHTGAKTITPNMGTSVTEIAQASSDCVVFPNPATSELTLKMGEGSFTSLAITNSMGAVVMNQSINKASITLEIKNLATGIYYIRLTGSGNNVVKMFVKQ